MDRGTPRNVMNELHIRSNQYNLVTVSYYVQQLNSNPCLLSLTFGKIPYIVAEAPFNLLVKYAKPSVWQARVMVSNFRILYVYTVLMLYAQISWGIVLICHAAVTNAGGLYTVRALLGLFVCILSLLLVVLNKLTLATRKLDYGPGSYFSFAIGTDQTNCPSV